MNEEQTTSETMTADGTGIFAIGASFEHGPSDDRVTVKVASGTVRHRVIEIDGYVLQTEPDEPQNGRRIHHLWKSGDWDERFVLVLPAMAAWMHRRDLIYVPNETVDIPGLWTVFVKKGKEEETSNALAALNQQVFEANCEFRDADD